MFKIKEELSNQFLASTDSFNDCCGENLNGSVKDTVMAVLVEKS